MDWKLLLFLVLFLNVKLIIKVAALILIYLFNPNLKFGFRLKDSRLPLFYPVVIGIALLNTAFNLAYHQTNYLVVLATGIGFWVMCILAIHQLKLSVEKNDAIVIHNTLLLFFIINIAVSFMNYGLIVWETGTINAFTNQANYQKYFISTGDYIKGLSFDTSTTNAIISAAGMIYFLVRKQLLMFLLCSVVVLLTGSNFTNILLSMILVLLFVFKTDRVQKSLIVINFLLLVIFMVKVSPQNNTYLADAYQRNIKGDTIFNDIIITKDTPLTKKPDSILSIEQRKEKIAMLYIDSIAYVMTEENRRDASLSNNSYVRYEIPGPNIHTKPFQARSDTTATQIALMNFIAVHDLQLSYEVVSHPGKLLALRQMFDYFKARPKKIFTGAGMGNFSSKLAFRTTTLPGCGGYPKQLVYIHPDFENNHLKTYLAYFSRSGSFHSLTNTPNSAYFQVLAEYGLAGVIAFIFYYLFYFAKHYRKLTYGLPLLLLMCGAFFVDYWFEQLSIVILIELMLLLDIKETKTETTN